MAAKLVIAVCGHGDRVNFLMDTDITGATQTEITEMDALFNRIDAMFKGWSGMTVLNERKRKVVKA